MNRSNLRKSSALITGAITLLSLLTVVPQQAQGLPTKPTVTRADTSLSFRGNVPKAAQVGAEYILFQTDKNNQVRGLVYLQNSDIGACFKGDYEIAGDRIQNLTYAYPMIGETESGWEMNVAIEALSLEEFPHPLNQTEVNDSTQQWFQQCLELFN
ncbi:MAG: hypothetical protein ACRC8A_06485 [Microcoleaceae cyanobacterium]